MKRLIAALTLLAVAGCDSSPVADPATEFAIDKECEKFSGSLSTYRRYTNVAGADWRGTCINRTTSIMFYVYVATVK